MLLSIIGMTDKPAVLGGKDSTRPPRCGVRSTARNHHDLGYKMARSVMKGLIPWLVAAWKRKRVARCWREAEIVGIGRVSGR